MTNRMRIALLQLLARDTKSKILQKAEEYITQAAKNETKLAILPELFTVELHPPVMMANKESIPDGETCQLMSHLAKKHNMHIIAGSVPEEIKGSEKMKNTTAIFNPKGELEGRYTKMHSFDVDLGEHLCIHESEWYEHGHKPATFKTVISRIDDKEHTAGVTGWQGMFTPLWHLIPPLIFWSFKTIFNIDHGEGHVSNLLAYGLLRLSDYDKKQMAGQRGDPFFSKLHLEFRFFLAYFEASALATDICKVGVGICIDVRFPEVSRYYTEQDCKLHVYLGAFSAERTGPAHWDVLLRARAIDNQVYIAACSPAADKSHHYEAWGHSAVVDPWGKIISQAEGEEALIYADLDMNYLNKVRGQLPTENIRRKDLYHLTYNW